MLKPSIDELVQIAGSRYSLVIITSKRARKLIEGELPMIETPYSKPVSIAVREMYNGKFLPAVNNSVKE